MYFDSKIIGEINCDEYTGVIDVSNYYGEITINEHLRQYIYNIDDLQNINLNLGGEYYLMNDLNLDGVEFTPIGFGLGGFYGKFYGNNHTIQNINIFIDSDEPYIGFFSIVGGLNGKSGYVEKLNLVNTTVIAQKSIVVGGFVGWIIGESVIKGCSVTNANVMGNYSAGGFVGELSNNTVIEQCFVNRAGVYSATDSAGGFVGDNCTLIKNCYAINIDCVAEEGFVGYFGGYNSGFFENCWVASNGELMGQYSVYSFAGACIDTNTIDCIAFGNYPDPISHGINSFPYSDFKYFGGDIDPTDWNFDMVNIWENNQPNGLNLRIFGK